MTPQLQARVALGRAIRARAEAMVADRGLLAERAAWCAARAPWLTGSERAFREAVAARVSRLFALVGIDQQH